MVRATRDGLAIGGIRYGGAIVGGIGKSPGRREDERWGTGGGRAAGLGSSLITGASIARATDELTSRQTGIRAGGGH